MKSAHLSVSACVEAKKRCELAPSVILLYCMPGNYVGIHF